jgi:hypothetical protein
MVGVTHQVLRRRDVADQGKTPRQQRVPVDDVDEALSKEVRAVGEKASTAPAKAHVPDEDLWTIHGVRYDMRKFVSRHPGGVRAIELGRGIDCTILFETYHPFTKRHRQVLGAYRYDDAPANSDDQWDWKNSPFYEELKAAARAYFSPRGDETDHEVQRNSKASTESWLRHIVGTCLLIAAFYAWLQGTPGSMLFFPIVYWIVASDLMHNGSHFCMSMKPWINTVSNYM